MSAHVDTQTNSPPSRRPSHGVPAGTPCANCGTKLLGAWCYHCGQAATDFHRHAHHLLFETFESFFHADGRLWRTVWGLVCNPARLTRAYLAGKRAPQIPPLRLFLVTLLILFLAGNIATGSHKTIKFDGAPPDIRAKILTTTVHFGLGEKTDAAATAWLREHIGRAVQHPDALILAMREQAQDFAFLMLPVSAFILAGIFLFRRGVLLFDHFIFAMHSLSFQGLLISTVIGADAVIGAPAATLLWAAPVHLFVHMRGTYQTGMIGTVVRMTILFCATAAAFTLLLAGLVIAGTMAIAE